MVPPVKAYDLHNVMIVEVDKNLKINNSSTQ